MPLTLGYSVSRSHPLLLQTIYLDQLQIFGDDGGASSPTPSVTAAPVTSPVAAPVVAPVAAPVAVGTEIVGGAVYVERIEAKGVDILAEQEDGTALVVSTRVRSLDTNDVRVADETDPLISRQGFSAYPM